MELRDYLRKRNLKPSQLAALMGCHASTITRVLKGERSPSLVLMKSISDATNGEVTPNDFIAPPVCEDVQ